MDTRLLKFASFALLASAITCNSIAQTDASAGPASSPEAPASQINAVATKYVGTWRMFTRSWGSWEITFSKPFETPDGKIQLNGRELYDPSKATRLTAELADDGSLVLLYKRPACKGMPDVGADGIHRMRFKPINETGTKLEATMISNDCRDSQTVQLFKS